MMTLFFASAIAGHFASCAWFSVGLRVINEGVHGWAQVSEQAELGGEGRVVRWLVVTRAPTLPCPALPAGALAAQPPARLAWLAAY